MSRRRWVMGNWKMVGSVFRIQHLLNEMIRLLPDNPNAEIVVFPPSVYLFLVQDLLNKSIMKWGAQNVYPASEGAFTGEIGGPMLREMGCKYILIGHSERRHLLGESNDFVAKKFEYAKQQGFTPIYCVGETLAQRDAGLTHTVIQQQLESLEDNGSTLQGSIVAYEPVWAIGTGKAASSEDIQEVHQMIRTYLKNKDQKLAEETSILYGGSVTPENAQAIFSLNDVDGGLVGGASLEAARFIGIIQCINS